MAKSIELSASRNVLNMPGAGRPERVMDITHTYLVEQQQTDGSLVCLDLIVPPGHGLPQHTHHLEDETFYVLAGSIEFIGDDMPEPTPLSQGGLFHGPHGRAHGFRNTGKVPARLLVFVTPGNNIQRMFADLAALTARSVMLPAPGEINVLCAKYEIVFAASLEGSSTNRQGT